jgi:hypothetical protein
LARLFMTGFETGSTSPFAGVNTAQKRGAWSTYSCVGNTGPSQLFTTGVAEFYVGVGFYMSSISGGTQFLTFYNMNANLAFRLSIDAAGHILAVRGDGSTRATSSLTLTTATWYYVQTHVKIDDSTGLCEVLVDGTQFINLTGDDTRSDATTNGEKVNRVGFSDSGNYYVDDLYFNDTTGSQNNGYSGDTRVAAYIPNAAGDSTGLTRGGTDSGNNYGQVDERPPNDGTDYVFGTDTSSYDLYNLPATSGVSTVQGVQLWVRAAKSDAGAASIALMLKSGGTEDQQADQALSTSYGYFYKTYDVDPTDSVAWTAAKVDGLQIGIKSR